MQTVFIASPIDLIDHDGRCKVRTMKAHLLTELARLGFCGLVYDPAEAWTAIGEFDHVVKTQDEMREDWASKLHHGQTVRGANMTVAKHADIFVAIWPHGLASIGVVAEIVQRRDVSKQVILYTDQIEPCRSLYLAAMAVVPVAGVAALREALARWIDPSTDVPTPKLTKDRGVVAGGFVHRSSQHDGDDEVD